MHTQPTKERRLASSLLVLLVGITATAPACDSGSSNPRDVGGDAAIDVRVSSDVGTDQPIPDSGDTIQPIDIGPPDADSGDAATPQNPPPEVEFQLASCVGLSGSDQPCYWRYKYDASLCNASTPCEKLAIYYSGGGMVCDEGFGDATHYTSKVLEAYAADAYVAVCANITLDRASAPFLAEVNRVDLLQEAITSSSAIRSIWTGEALLFSGVSHGATAPVVAMASTTLDDGSAWHGSQKTGACFLDGTYDTQASNAYLLSFPVQCNTVRQSLICDRYFGGDCAQFDATDAEYLADTVSKTSASSFSIKDWKLIECGSALPGCLGDRDWIPAGPIAELCASIDSGADHSCVNDPVPDEGHLSCSAGSGSTKCRTWFNAL